MKVAILILCLAVSIQAAPAPSVNAELNEFWETFKTTYAKKYTPQYEYIRRLVWESNLKFIQSHNLEYNMGKHKYALGMNEFGDMTFEEFSSKYLGYKHDFTAELNKTTAATHMAPMNSVKLPDSVDWRTQGMVTPVKNQGQCGSCWSFSTTGSLEGQYKRKSGTLVSFSEKQLMDCSKSYGNMGCNGGLMANAMLYVKQYGIEPESVYPYVPRDGPCRYDATKVVTKDQGPSKIPSGDEDKLKEAVANVGPISVAIDAGHPSFQFYTHGVYDEPRCSSTRLDHGVLAVGYGTDTQTGDDYWLVKNSWGTSWGKAGYINMSRNKDNQCGIATQASYPIL